jgi:hypothetical protein
MALTYTAIATVTVGSGGASTMEFTSIPATYTDLVIKISARDGRPTNKSNYIEIQFNNSTSTYNILDAGGTGSAAYASTNDLGSNKPYAYGNAAGSTASTFGNSEIYIPNYAGSSAKSMSIDSVTENNGTEARAVVSAAYWSGTSAITSIKLTSYGGNSFVQYTNATLYGIKNTV